MAAADNLRKEASGLAGLCAKLFRAVAARLPIEPSRPDCFPEQQLKLALSRHDIRTPLMSHHTYASVSHNRRI